MTEGERDAIRVLSDRVGDLSRNLLALNKRLDEHMQTEGPKLDQLNAKVNRMSGQLQAEHDSEARHEDLSHRRQDRFWQALAALAIVASLVITLVHHL